MLLDKRTLAYLRNAEFGFFGVNVPTRVQTPRFCGEFTLVKRFLKLLYPLFKAGESAFFGLFTRPLRINWLIVGILSSSFPSIFLYAKQAFYTHTSWWFIFEQNKNGLFHPNNCRCVYFYFTCNT